MNILVTGGAGYIGSHTVRKLKELGHNVIVLDNLERGNARNCESMIFKEDIRDERALDKIFSQNRFDLVCHFAALISVPESMEKPDMYYDVNVEGTKTLLRVMKKHNCNRLIFSSTASLYERSKEPVVEDNPIKPLNVYAKTKLEVEQYLQQQEWLDYVIFRYFNVVGYAEWFDTELERQKTNIVPALIKAYETKSKFKIFGNCHEVTRAGNKKDHTCVRDYIDVRDIANAYQLAIDYMMSHRTCREVFNLGTKSGYSVLELLKEFRKANPDLHIKYQLEKPRKGDPAIVVANAQKANELLRWKPQYTLQQSLTFIHE